MTTGERWTLGHRPALDGLRGVAILLVVLYHAQIPGLGAAGSVGVAVFFTLSGFLITALLLEERQREGRIDLGAFYKRRARRLFPALAANVLVVAAVGVFFSGFATPQGVLVVVTYVSNWAMAAPGYIGGFGHTWSLAIEEQFYLLWPVVLIGAARFGGVRGVAWVAALGASGSAALRLAMWTSGAADARLYFGSDTRADGLLIGCLLACWLHSRSCGKARGAVVPLMLLGTFTLFGSSMAAVTVVPLLTAAVIFFIARGEQVGALSSPWLRYVGRRAYGLYLWHSPVSVLLDQHLDVSWTVHALVMIPSAFLLAELSWRYIEQPFMRKKKDRRQGVATSSRPSDSSPATTATRAAA